MTVESKTLKPVVELKHIRKEFPGVVALDDMNLTLYPGEVHALMGENGSGKSTLIKVLSGIHSPTGGTILIDGQEVILNTPSKALELGIVPITQELTLAPSLTVAENICLGRLPMKGFMIDWPKTYQMAEHALKQLGIEVDVRRQVSELSAEIQQEIEIARAISMNSRVLIFDEATSSLSMHATKMLLNKIDQLRSKGVAIVFVSHRMAEIYACCQRATILRDGKFIDTVSVSETPVSEMVRKMVGRPITDLYPKKISTPGNSLLEVTGLSTSDEKVRDVSFHVRCGEIIGIAGLVGCGKTELGLALFGAITANCKEISFKGKPLKIRNTMDAIKHGIAFVPEDRKISGIFTTRTVAHNLSITWLDKINKRIGLDVKKERSISESIRQRFRIKTASIHTLITSLSGGNQQKIVLGRWFENKSKLIILTEPTRGVDIAAKKEIYEFIQEMANNGAAVIMISSELPEILGLSDRILVMYQGEIVKEFKNNEATEEAIAHYAFGGVEANHVS